MEANITCPLLSTQYPSYRALGVRTALIVADCTTRTSQGTVGGGSKSEKGEKGTASEPTQELLGDIPRMGSFATIIHVWGA